MSDTTPVEELDLTELGIAIRSFRNLFYHRTVLLEGIRRMAVRNLTHLADAKRRCGVNSSEVEHEWVPRVRAKMLADQGMENNPTNRTILLPATFLPVQVYLALFYAELECVRDWQGQSEILSNEGLLQYLYENDEAINKLRRYRHSFLHPKPTAGRREQEYLAHSESFQRTPEMQEVLDSYLRKVNSDLFGALKDLVGRLPENAKLACVGLALKASSSWMDVHCDQEGQKHVETEQTKLYETLVSMAEAGQPWVTPTPRQTEIIVELAGYMSTVSRSRKEYQFEVSETRQPPMAPPLVMPLFRSVGSERYGDSRTARQVARSDGAIGRLLAAAAVMLNEDVGRKAGHPGEKLLSREEFEAVIDDHVGRGLSQLNLAAGPARLTLALCYEPLRWYSALKQEDPTVHDDTLSAFIGDSLVTLREFRNSVFHVSGPDKDPNDLDTAIAEPFVKNMGHLYLGLAGFFGIRSRPPVQLLLP